MVEDNKNKQKSIVIPNIWFKIFTIVFIYFVFWIIVGKEPIKEIKSLVTTIYSENESEVSNPIENLGQTILKSQPIKSYEDKILERLNLSMDIENDVTRAYSLELASKYPGNYSIYQICNIYNELYNNWKYVNDPRGQDYFAKASFSIKAGMKGDCDDFAILMATIIESIGGKTRIVISQGLDGKGHAYTEVFMGNKNKMQGYYEAINMLYSDSFERILGVRKIDKICYSIDNNDGAWLNLDWTSKFPGGEYFNSTSKITYYPREGRYELSDF